jgi:Ni/Co efflux regulator RcnB
MRDRDNNMRGNDNNNMRDHDRDNGPDKKVVVHKTVDRSVVLKMRANIKAPHRYHAAKIYVRPPGWYPHRWVYGERLPRAFFAPDYFILDFAAYGLMAPWDGYEWVRYGDDALLVDVETGEVIRVEYDVFY